jgi:hypothetical protein
VINLEPFRVKFRKQLVDHYKHDLENGALTVDRIQQMAQQLETALRKAKKTKRRVIVEGQESLGSVGVAEIEDQIFALQETMK